MRRARASRAGGGAVVTLAAIDYRRYLRSPEWRTKRYAAIVRAGYRCAVCHRVYWDERKLQVHHVTYDRLGREQPEDLMVLCRRCHRRVSR